MNLWDHHFSQNANQKFKGFLPYPLINFQGSKISNFWLPFWEKRWSHSHSESNWPLNDFNFGSVSFSFLSYDGNLFSNSVWSIHNYMCTTYTWSFFYSNSPGVISNYRVFHIEMFLLKWLWQIEIYKLDFAWRYLYICLLYTSDAADE